MLAVCTITEQGCSGATDEAEGTLFSLLLV